MDDIRLILETIGRMSDGATHIGTWWLVLHYGIKALAILVLGGGAIFVVRLIVSAVVTHSHAYRLVQEISEVVDGTRTNLDYQSHRVSLVNKVLKLKEREK
jgi:hypothetical protein